MTQANIDPVDFRRALGSFATGVTIITTRTADGEALGLTVNSFNSVSLNPPMVLWSLAETYMGYAAFQNAQYWAVHVLSAKQEPLSNRFASKGEDKFRGLDLEEGLGGVPLLRGCSARFVCETAFQYEGGDHRIFVGEVKAFEQTPTPPLVFHSGRYAHATPRQPGEDEPRHPYLAGSFDENFLGYLLGRSHYRFFAQIRPHLQSEGLSDEEFYLLSTLTLKRSLNSKELDSAMSGILAGGSAAALDSLRRRNLVTADEPSDQIRQYQLSAAGRQLALRLIAAAKVTESQIAERLGEADAVVLKALLIRLLGAIDPDAKALWE